MAGQVRGPEPPVHIDFHEIDCGDGSSGVRPTARGARWADAEVSDDYLRTHLDTLDTKSSARQQQLDLMSLETAPGMYSFRAHSSNRRGRSELGRAPFRQSCAHSSHGNIFDNLGKPHNWGMLSVDGMRREPGPARLSPSVCRLCGRPNSRSTEWHHLFSFASATPRASAAGGAQTHGCTRTRVHTQACHGTCRSTHDACM